MTGGLSPALRRRAAAVGIAVDYTDAAGVGRTSSPEATEAICELMGEPGQPAPGAREDPVAPVVLLRGGRLRSGLVDAPHGNTGAEGPEKLRVKVTLEDGSAAPDLRAGTPGSVGEQIAAAGLPPGIHTLEWSTGARSGTSTLLAAPERFPLRANGTSPSLVAFVPPYAPWTRENPMCSVDRLEEFGAALAGSGVRCVATLPVGAPGLGERFDSSPYSPVSRFHLNELLVSERHLPELLPDELPADPAAPVDWPTVLRARTRQLEEVALTLPPRRRRDLDCHLAAHPDIASYARFCAQGDSSLRRACEVGQWLAHESLERLSSALAARDQVLALDVPVGARGDSWETWAHPELFVAGASIGAPPDSFFTEGQDWGLPPLDPVASRTGGHRVWADLLERACRYAGVLRIDHVMQFHRLWWVPDGHDAADGAYVHYPADELLAVAAIVATRNGTAMVGEDLGTVPPEVKDLLADWGLAGMYEEQFALHDGATELPAVPAGSWAGIRTHDMAPLAAVAAEVDTAPYRKALSAALGRRVGRSGGELAEAMMRRLASSDAAHVVVDMDDALGDPRSHNVPGTVDAQNWSHRLRLPTNELAEHPGVRRVLAAASTRN